MTSPLILVVEDDPDVLALLVSVLATQGYRVATATDGVEALAAARAEVPNLIVLDLMMPRMNAIQFRAAQRRDAALSHVPVVCLSAVSHASTVAYEIGTEDCLSKPLDIDRLIAVVKKYCDPGSG